MSEFLPVVKDTIVFCDTLVTDTTLSHIGTLHSDYIFETVIAILTILTFIYKALK